MLYLPGGSIWWWPDGDHGPAVVHGESSLPPEERGGLGFEQTFSLSELDVSGSWFGMNLYLCFGRDLRHASPIPKQSSGEDVGVVVLKHQRAAWLLGWGGLTQEGRLSAVLLDFANGDILEVHLFDEGTQEYLFRHARGGGCMDERIWFVFGDGTALSFVLAEKK
jgi:hypothetical protein